jgi:hypothetical protein
MGKYGPVCRACGAEHDSLVWAHCSACHRTFSTERNFDQHRRGPACLDPALVGLVPSPTRGTYLPGGGLWVAPAEVQERAQEAPAATQATSGPSAERAA